MSVASTVFPNLVPDLSHANLGQGFGNWFTGNLDYQRQLEMLQQQQHFNANQAQIQRDFEERLSNTAYQRAVADLEGAGFNKGLLLGSASPSATPSGATASSPGSSYSSSGGKGFSSLLSLAASIASLAVGAYVKGADRIAKFNTERSFDMGFTKGYASALNRRK